MSLVSQDPSTSKEIDAEPVASAGTGTPSRLEVPGADDKPSHLAYHLRVADASREDGRDFCVVWCHGFGSSRLSEKTLAFAKLFLARGVSFCSFDFQGHGESGGDMVDMSFSRHLADLGHMLEHLRSLGFRRFVLYGSSMGGGVSAWYSALNPDQVVAALFIAPGFFLEGGVRRRIGEDAFARWPEEKQITLHHELGSFRLDWRMIEDLRTYDRARLTRIYQTPTLIFQGKKDADVDWRMVLDFAVDCPAECVQLHLLTDGDHRLADRIPLMWGLTEAFLREQGLWPDVEMPSDESERMDHG